MPFPVVATRQMALLTSVVVNDPYKSKEFSKVAILNENDVIEYVKAEWSLKVTSLIYLIEQKLDERFRGDEVVEADTINA